MDNTIGFPNTYPINYPVDSAVIGLKQLAQRFYFWRAGDQTAQQALGSSGRKRERARARETRVSPSRAPVSSCAHYFQAPASRKSTDAGQSGQHLTRTKSLLHQGYMFQEA